MHMSLLNPSHDDLIMQHLAKVHASGRRSKVLDVGTVGLKVWARVQSFNMAGAQHKCVTLLPMMTSAGRRVERETTLTAQGTGTWAVSLALRHPFADVIGIE